MHLAFSLASSFSPSHGLVRCRRLALALLWLVLAGCTPLHTPPSATLAERTYWSGRLVVQVEDQTTQSFAAAFELQGTPAHGELTLLSPLGNVLARLQWAPGQATLQSGGQTRTSESLDVLLEQIAGTSLPVRALFGWLRGLQTTASGWQADLGNIGHGQLVATRYEPAPRATLRVVFEH